MLRDAQLYKEMKAKRAEEEAQRAAEEAKAMGTPNKNNKKGNGLSNRISLANQNQSNSAAASMVTSPERKVKAAPVDAEPEKTEEERAEEK